MKRLMVIAAGLLAAAALVTACGNGDATTTTTAPGDVQPSVTSQTNVQQQVEDVIGTLRDIGLDLSGESFDDLDVPVADMDVPELEPGSFDLDIDFDIEPSLPSLSLPDADSLVGSTAIDFMPEIPEGFVPDDSICEQFASVPDCSFVPEQYRELCEQCKEQNQQ